MLAGTEVIDWIRGIEILSLDFARPVYGQLGVRIEYEETLRGLARDALVGRFSGQKVAFCLDSWKDPATTYAVWIVPFLAAVERSLGSNDRGRIIYWIKYVACNDERNPWMLYEQLLSSWASVFRRTGVDRFGLAAGAAAMAAEFQIAHNIDEPKDLLAKQKARFLTDWDLPRFTRLGLLEIPAGSEFFPFVDALILIIRMNRFQCFWRRLPSYVGSDDLERIGFAALQLAGENGIAYCTPEELTALASG